MTKAYADFLKSKKIVFGAIGPEIQETAINPVLFPFQRALVRWAARKGRACVFADCGLGKTLIQIEWARLLGGRSLIVAPLSVVNQTIGIGQEHLSLELEYITDASQIKEDRIYISNYERLHHFVGAEINSLVTDESSILKSLDGKTRGLLISEFQNIPYRLCCTATPCPNDIAELANHSAFLGIMTRAEMLATFFVHDENGWRLRGYAAESLWKWLVSWGCYLRKPSDIGFEDDGFNLPGLSIEESIVHVDYHQPGELFARPLKGISGRSEVRRATLDNRLEEVQRIIQAEPEEQFIAWCGLNDEGRKLYKALEGAVLIEGSDSLESKIEKFNQFKLGQARILITKPKIAQFGMNFQNCARMVFVGLSDSYESYYQCIRRCWRFGQKKKVRAVIVVSNVEESIIANVHRKEREAKEMIDGMISNMSDLETQELHSTQKEQVEYKEVEKEGNNWKMIMGDCAEVMARLGPESIDLSVYSPPFVALYTYTASERDMGNNRTEEGFFEHWAFMIRELLRITKPGRNTCCHVSQIPAMLVRDNYIGMKDFRGKTIVAFEREGWIYHGEVCIDKDPQAQAIRVHAKGLAFGQLKKDASWLRPALADYILVFRKPGDNQVPIKPDITNNQWIEWARPIWYGIRESNTLSRADARNDKDDRHICPLQLEVIERCIRLWSNPGELILSPFAGIGSEGYIALQQNRKFIGIELKEEYFNVACRNLESIKLRQEQQALL